jgi:hypothetical protein
MQTTSWTKDRQPFYLWQIGGVPRSKRNNDQGGLSHVPFKPKTISVFVNSNSGHGHALHRSAFLVFPVSLGTRVILGTA